MKKIFTAICILLLAYTIPHAQSGPFDFSANTTDNASVTQVVDGVTLTISANLGGNIDLVDALEAWGLGVTTTPPQAIEMNGVSSIITLSFSQTVNITTLHCFEGSDNNNYYWDFNPTGGSNSPVLNQRIYGAGGSTITLNWIGITKITVTLHGGGGGIFWGFDDIVMDEFLPVELTSFTGTAYGSIVALDWATATEVNNYGFAVERLAVSDKLLANSQELNANGWQKIAFVQGHGNSNSPKSYSFEDKNPPIGRVQYRLKQIDFNGVFEYSPIVEVKVEAPSQLKLAQNYPNPFNPETTINFQIPFASKVTLKVYDVLGREVAKLVDEYKQAGNYNTQFSTLNSQLTSGIYFYKLQTDNGYSETKKLMLMK